MRINEAPHITACRHRFRFYMRFADDYDRIGQAEVAEKARDQAAAVEQEIMDLEAMAIPPYPTVETLASEIMA